MSGPALLEVRGLVRAFGGVVAVDRLDLDAHEKTIVGLIGPNGAGKTTVFNLISGLLTPQQGVIRMEGRDITGLPPHRVSACRIARTFQNVRLFDRMTVLENVMVGRHARTRAGLVSALLKLPSERREERRTVACCMEFLGQVGLADRASEPAGNLPFGLMRKLEIARALANEPRLILLDEPAAGLNQTETERLAALIQDIQGQGITVILVEHDMRLVMEISDRVAVLDQGRKIADGKPREVQNNPLVIAAYLGEPAEEKAGPGRPERTGS